MVKAIKTNNLLSPKKLLNSKWTACTPKNKEKHFLVTHVKLNEEDTQKVDFIILTAAFNNKNYKMNYLELKNSLIWKQGWK